MENSSGNLTRWLRNWLIMAVGILIVSRGGLVDGIRCSDGLTLLAVVALLSLFNALLRPLLMVVALPLIVVSFGLFLLPAIWLINATILYLVGHTMNLDGFVVESFGSAMWGSLWISLISYLLNALLGTPKKGDSAAAARRPGGKKLSGDDVIDV